MGGPTGGEGLQSTAPPQSNQCKSELNTQPSKNTKVKDCAVAHNQAGREPSSLESANAQV